MRSLGIFALQGGEVQTKFLICPPAGTGRASQGFHCPFAVVSQLEFPTHAGFAVPFAPTQ
jgi:hypothetical protein